MVRRLLLLPTTTVVQACEQEPLASIIAREGRNAAAAAREGRTDAREKEKLKSRYQELEASSRLYAATPYIVATHYICEA